MDMLRLISRRIIIIIIIFYFIIIIIIFFFLNFEFINQQTWRKHRREY